MKKERNYYKNMNFSTKIKFILTRRKEFMNFLGKGKVDIMDFWEYMDIFFNAGYWQKDNPSLVFTKPA